MRSKTHNSHKHKNQLCDEDIGLIRVKEKGWTGFSRSGRAAPRDFPRAKPEGNPKEQLEILA